MCLAGTHRKQAQSCNNHASTMQASKLAHARPHQGSMSMTCEAAVRLSATPPALSDIRNTRTCVMDRMFDMIVINYRNSIMCR